MQPSPERPDAGRMTTPLQLNALFDPPGEAASATELARSSRFRRRRFAFADGNQVLVDTFPDHPGVSCCFVRTAKGAARTFRIMADGVAEVVECAAGGWLLRSAGGAERSRVTYWVPRHPACRTVDAHGRILSQQDALLHGFGGSAIQVWVDVDVVADTHLDFAIWRFPDAGALLDALDAPTAIERQRWFLRSSHTVMRQLADVYQCLVHGWVYDNRFVWRRIWGGYRWRICSENEAHSLYMALNGLERSTGRSLYGLLKRQIVVSLITRQSQDGGWHHGEWTDLNESHFRLHSAGLLVLAAAMEECPDPAVARALEAAARFLASKCDRTDVGLWFLHDALEESVERATSDGAPPWTPTRMLGASESNKLILNTHLDSMVALARYREVTGDVQHSAAVDSGRAAAQAVLAMRPAEWLYRLVYRAVSLTLFPADRASRLSLPLKVVRRLARERLNPALYRLKHRYPRFVMPGGLIDRHLSPKHFDMGYHPVNLMDVIRLSRRFPQDDYRAVVRGAVAAVTDNGLLQFWLESKHRQPLGFWVEALYHLCVLDDASDDRARLAQAVLYAEDAGLGIPPALLGADPEAVAPAHQAPSPSPRDLRLRVVNLSHAGREEFLVVNVSREPVPLEWDAPPPADTRWTVAGGPQDYAPGVSLAVPARGWLRGHRG
jgi:hypothetical protein